MIQDRVQMIRQMIQDRVQMVQDQVDDPGFSSDNPGLG